MTDGQFSRLMDNSLNILEPLPTATESEVTGGSMSVSASWATQEPGVHAAAKHQDRLHSNLL